MRARLRMKDLVEATGLERQAIHFYIQQGLLPAGRKTGRNMAWYTQAHVDRLLSIRKLQQEHFLPLKAIKAVLDGTDEDFSPEQRAFLRGVKRQLRGELSAEDRGSMLGTKELTERYGVDQEDLEEAAELGVVGVSKDEHGNLMIAEADAWMVELFGQMRKLGFTRELGFSVADLRFYEDAMNRLFREEIKLISGRLSTLQPDEAAAMIEKALPLIHSFLTRYHASRVRAFFGALEDE